MQALVNEILQRIIHKAMALNAADAIKQRRGYAHPHVGAFATVVGAHMASMLSAFINHTQRGGLQALGQAGVDLCAQGHGVGAHLELPSSLGK